MGFELTTLVMTPMYPIQWRGCLGCDCMVFGLQLPMQSVPIISNVVSFNPTHGEAYSIQHYVIKFVSDLRHVGGFLRVLLVSSTNKIHRHDITEIMLKVGCIEYASPWVGLKLTTLEMIGTDCIGSCKSKYHTITTKTTPSLNRVHGGHLCVTCNEVSSVFAGEQVRDLISIRL
jgi:hypothetical protein